MSLICTPNLQDILSDAILVVDTCVLIDASKNREVSLLLSGLEKAGCVFETPPAVLNEFTCNAKDRTEYKEMRQFFESLNIGLIHRIEDHFLDDAGPTFDMVIRRCKVNRPSYVDRLVLFVPYWYKAQKMLVITSNHKDVPHEFYDLVGHISYESKNEFRNIGVYSFNREKFDKIAKKL